MPLLPQALLPASLGMDNTSDAEVISVEKAQYLQNALFDKAGMLRTNVRVVDLLASPWPDAIDGVGWYYQTPYTSDLALFVAGGKLYSCTATPGSPVPTLGTPTLVPGLVAPFTPGVGVRFIQFNEELIILPADGGIPPMRFTVIPSTFPPPTGPHLFPLGISPPAAPVVTQVPPPPVSNKQQNAPFVYRYAYTFFDERFRESSLSPVTDVTYTGGAHGSVPAPAIGGDPQVRGAYLYEAVPGNNTFYRVATFAPGDPAFIDNLHDNDITILPSQWVDPNNFQAYDMPHNASVGCAHKNYLFLNDMTAPQNLQVSNLSSPTQFSPINILPTEGGSFTVDTDQGDPVMALVPYGSLMKIWKVRGFFVMFGDFVSDFTIRALHMRGTVCSDSAVRCDNDVLSHSLDGVYAYNYSSGFLSNRLSQEIQQSFDALVTDPSGQAKIIRAHAAYVDNKYFLWIDNTCYLYDFRSQKPAWTTLSFTIPPPPVSTATFTYVWNSDLQGWNPDSTGVNFGWQSDDGTDFTGASAVGCVRTGLDVLGSSTSSSFALIHAKQTWEYWGVPAGKAVVKVTGRVRAKQVMAANLTHVQGQITLQGPPYDDTSWLYLSSAPDLRTLLGSAWQTVTFLSPCVPVGWSASGTVMELEILINVTASPPNPAGTGYEYRWDTLELDIEYADTWFDACH